VPHVPYDTLRGDPFFELDARVSKNVKLGGKRRCSLASRGFTSRTAPTMATISVTSQRAGLHEPAGFTNPTSSSTAKAFIGEFGARFTF